MKFVWGVTLGELHEDRHDALVRNRELEFCTRIGQGYFQGMSKGWAVCEDLSDLRSKRTGLYYAREGHVDGAGEIFFMPREAVVAAWTCRYNGRQLW
jgi:hypothetical protein